MSRATAGVVDAHVAARATRSPGPRRLDTAIARALVDAGARPTLLESKLRTPRLGFELIQRENLVATVSGADTGVVAVCAPAGYGKTTLLSQVATAIDAPVAWLSLDNTDNDPAQLLTALAASLDRCVGLDPRVLQALWSPEPDAFTQLLPALVNSLSASPQCVLILDDVQRVTAQASMDVFTYLGDHLPAGVRLVVAGRSLSGMQLGRLRAQRMLVELGPGDLSLTPIQARQLLESLDVHVGPKAFESVYAETEGWPAGIYLAALAARGAADPESVLRAFDGADPSIVEFLTTEHLAHETNDHRAFLLRTSVLDRFSAPLCDAVLERDDSGTVLAAMEQSNGFVIPLDRRRQWYRFHRMFGQALQANLERREPGRARAIHQRASGWYAAHADWTPAIEQAISGRDEERVAQLLCSHIQGLFDGVQPASLCRWIDSLSEAKLREFPTLAVAGAWLMLQQGELDRTRHFMRALEGVDVDVEGQYPFGESSGRSAVSLLLSTLGWEGVSRIGKQAEVVRRLEPPVSRAYRAAGLSLAASLLLQERGGGARDLLEDAAELAPSAVDVVPLVHALLALRHLEERRASEADLLVRSGLARLDVVGLGDCLARAALLTAAAWLDLTRQHGDSARARLDQATALLPRTQVVPWLTIYLQIVLSRIALELDEVARAEPLLAAARRGLIRHPDAGVLPHMLASVERALAAAHGGSRTLVEPLTQAEMRVLELAPTCLSIEEIGRTLCLSKNTVKTHLKAIYAKLSVVSRSDAVERARGLRLIP